jgi:tetratricopeptide (TPR) repeat protein
MKKLALLVFISFILGCTDHTEEGGRLFQEGLFKDALYHFEKDLSIEPNNSMRLYNMGRCYEELSQYDQAITLFEKSIKNDPLFIDAYSGRGRCFYKKDEYASALIDFATVTSLDKTNAEPYYLAGLCYLKDSIYDKAAITFDKALKIDPNFHIARYNKAVANAAMANISYALKDFSYLIDEQAILPKSYLNRGFLYENMGNYASAINDYSKSIELGYVNELILTRRASCYLELNRALQACKDFQLLQHFNRSAARELIQKYCNE